jgi:hypothetical protein
VVFWIVSGRYGAVDLAQYSLRRQIPKTQEKVRHMTHDKFAQIVNDESIRRSTCLYTLDRPMTAFIKARLVDKASR